MTTVRLIDGTTRLTEETEASVANKLKDANLGNGVVRIKIQVRAGTFEWRNYNARHIMEIW